MKNADFFCCFVMSVVVVVVSFGAYCNGVDSCRKEMQQEAIERGFAEHDAKTGEWNWKGDETQ